jgi:hypothetical protein
VPEITRRAGPRLQGTVRAVAARDAPLFALEGAGGKLEPARMEQVKTGKGDEHVAAVRAGHPDVRVFERGEGSNRVSPERDPNEAP